MCGGAVFVQTMCDFVCIIDKERRCRPLSRATILKIKEAEGRAEQIRAEARDNAKQMLDRAERDGKELLASTEQRTQSECREKLASCREAAQKELNDERRALEAEAEKLALAAENHRKNAVKILVWGISDQCQ